MTIYDAIDDDIAVYLKLCAKHSELPERDAYGRIYPYGEHQKQLAAAPVETVVSESWPGSCDD